ncbi:hypothetical protein PR048_026860 [Dryococelus australis]|uniref:Uncharacterized protein n=1 Tax=Dryococelus australis TaxID=614101 RepID=A0ABQ9GMI3_9NEOP|nr:hypothetical protein PR048_026860 [Dryococelus australis]
MSCGGSSGVVVFPSLIGCAALWQRASLSDWLLHAAEASLLAVLSAGEYAIRYSLAIRYGLSPECKGRGEREIPEKTHRSAEPSGTIPTCENPEENICRGHNPVVVVGRLVADHCTTVLRTEKTSYGCNKTKPKLVARQQETTDHATWCARRGVCVVPDCEYRKFSNPAGLGALIHEEQVCSSRSGAGRRRRRGVLVLVSGSPAGQRERSRHGTGLGLEGAWFVVQQLASSDSARKVNQPTPFVDKRALFNSTFANSPPFDLCLLNFDQRICHLTCTVQCSDENAARLARRGDEALGVPELSPLPLLRFLTLDAQLQSLLKAQGVRKRGDLTRARDMLAAAGTRRVDFWCVFPVAYIHEQSIWTLCGDPNFLCHSPLLFDATVMCFPPRGPWRPSTPGAAESFQTRHTVSRVVRCLSSGHIENDDNTARQLRAFLTRRGNGALDVRSSVALIVPAFLALKPPVSRRRRNSEVLSVVEGKMT